MKVTGKQIDELIAKIFEDLDRWQRDGQPFGADEILGVRRVVKAELLKWPQPGGKA